MAEEQACLDLADLILETAQKVDRVAQASLAPGALHTPSINRFSFSVFRTHQGTQQTTIREMTNNDH